MRRATAAHDDKHAGARTEGAPHGVIHRSRGLRPPSAQCCPLILISRWSIHWTRAIQVDRTATRHARRRWNAMAIRVGPMNNPKKPKAIKPPNTPRTVSDKGMLIPNPISHGLTKLS